MRRNWEYARAKVDSERGCRVCGSRERVEAAHTIGRKYDRISGIFGGDGPGPTVTVNPDDVVPLCQTHHGEYDKHELDLLPYLTHDEQASAVRNVGIVSAMRRLTSNRN